MRVFCFIFLDLIEFRLIIVMLYFFMFAIFVKFIQFD